MTRSYALAQARKARIVQDSIGLVLTVAAGAMTICTIMIAMSRELIMSAYAIEMIVGTAWAWLAVLYFVVAIGVGAGKPQSKFTSLLCDAICLGTLIVTGVALVGTMSTMAGGYHQCMRTRPVDLLNCQFPIATIAVAWIAVVYIIALLALRVSTTVSRHGDSRATWRSSVAHLAEGREYDMDAVRPIRA